MTSAPNKVLLRVYRHTLKAAEKCDKECLRLGLPQLGRSSVKELVRYGGRFQLLRRMSANAGPRSETTEEIEVQATCVGEAEHPGTIFEPNSKNYRYEITLKNHGKHPVQLMRRKWKILDEGISEYSEEDKCSYVVEGDGVVGQCPVLPGAVGGDVVSRDYSYESHCTSHGALVNMHGEFQMKRWLEDGEEQDFSVTIPLFVLKEELESKD